MTTIIGGSSSGRKPRVLEIAVKNAALSKMHEGASTYVKIRIDKHKEAETKEVSCINGSKPEWNQGFVFTVKRSFVFDKDSMVRFEVFRTRKFLPDKTVGVALCKMDDFFKLGSAKKEDNGLEVAVKYDDSDWESNEEIQPEKKQQKEAITTLMGSANLRVDKGKYIVGWLSVDMVVWKGHPLLIGDCNWQNLAMDYEEFMGNKGEALKKKKKKKRLMCFGSSPTKI